MAAVRRLGSPVVYGLFKTIVHGCPHCGGPVPVNGPVGAVACPSCDGAVTIPPALWSKAILALTLQHVCTTSPGPASRGTADSKLQDARETIKTEFWVQEAPSCPHCGAPLPVPEDRFSEPTVAAPCPRCGASVSFVPVAPEIQQAISPSQPPLVCTHLAFRESDLCAPAASASVLPQGAKPVIFQCPQCSASLPIAADSKRTIACRYCQSSVYLPDGLWKELHPVKTAQAWSAVFRIDPLRVRAEVKRNASLLAVGLGAIGVGLPALLSLLGVLTVTEVISAKGGPKSGYPLLVIAGLIFMGWVVGCIVIWIKARGELRVADELDALAGSRAGRG